MDGYYSLFAKLLAPNKFVISYSHLKKLSFIPEYWVLFLSEPFMNIGSVNFIAGNVHNCLGYMPYLDQGQ